MPGHNVAEAVNGFLNSMGGFIYHELLTLQRLDLRGFARLVTASINQGNTSVRVPATEGTLVRFFTIVGDTGGPDISHGDNCNDHTRILRVEFAPVAVEWE